MATDFLPPHDTANEQGVIGCQMSSPNDCIPEVHEKTGGNISAFYDLRHQEIQRVLFEMWNERTPIDLITTQTRLRQSGGFEKVGGLPYLMELQGSVLSVGHLPEYLRVLNEKFLLRRMIQCCAEFSQRAMEQSEPAENLVDGFEREVMTLRKMRGGEGLKSIKEIVHESLADIEAQFKSGGKITGISTGLADLDIETDGLHPSELVLIAAFPSVGKTSLAMNIVEHVTLELGLPVGVFSAEMSGRSLVTRAICSQGRVNLRDVRDGTLSESCFPKITRAASRIAESKLVIDDTSDLTMAQIRAKARRMVQQHDIKLFVADYAQLFSSPGAENRTNEIDQVSKGFKNMAKELGVPVILLSQLTEDAKGGIHLKGARALGEDADGYWQLKRGKDSDSDVLAEPVELWIKKQRNGPRNVCVNLTFLKPFTRFESASKFNNHDIPTGHND